MGRLGLEGMTVADIAEMDADQAKEREHYHREIGKRLRWMKRDTSWRYRIYRLLDFFGFGYGVAYMDGWHDGIMEGRDMRQRELGRLYDKGINYFGGRKKRKYP